MRLFNRKTRRPSRRAQAAALKHKAGLEAKYAARNQHRRLRGEQRSADKVTRARVAALKAQEKAAIKTAERAERDLLSVASVRKYLGVARILLPVLLPLVYRAATFARQQLDSYRARRLGVDPFAVGDYTGHGARLNARIVNVENSTAELLVQAPNDNTAKTFAADTRERLAGLATAVHTAEQMPVTRRRAAHTAIASELSTIETELLNRLGVHRTRHHAAR